MELCKEPLLKAVDSLIVYNRTFVYVELGLAEGRTFFGVLNFVSSITQNFMGYGVDIENGWSLNLEELEKNSQGIDPLKFQISFDGSRKFLEHFQGEIDLLWIDACHAKECCMNDFLASESKVRSGGVVGFHDSGTLELGLDVQPHCGHPIGVREALEQLGLIKEERAGWKVIQDVQGDPRGCFLVQKL